MAWPAAGSSSARPKDLRCQDVELRRLVDALHAVLAEEVIAPGDQVVQVLHHHRLLVGDRAVVGDAMRLERVRSPVEHLILESLLSPGAEIARHARVAGQHAHDVLDALLDVLWIGRLEERLGDPVLAHQEPPALGSPPRSG